MHQQVKVGDTWCSCAGRLVTVKKIAMGESFNKYSKVKGKQLIAIVEDGFDVEVDTLLDGNWCKVTSRNKTFIYSQVKSRYGSPYPRINFKQPNILEPSILTLL